MNKDCKRFWCPLCSKSTLTCHRSRHLRSHGIYADGRGKKAKILNSEEQIDSENLRTDKCAEEINQKVDDIKTTTHNDLLIQNNAKEPNPSQEISQNLAAANKPEEIPLNNPQNLQIISLEKKVDTIMNFIEKLANQPNYLSKSNTEITSLPTISWKKLKKFVLRKCKVCGLKPETIRHYTSALNQIRERGFFTSDFSKNEGVDKILEFAQKTKAKQFNIYLSVVKRVQKTCFPDAKIEFPKHKMIQSDKTYPTIDEIITIICDMFNAHDFHLGITALFLLITGFRFNEAKTKTLGDFGTDLCLENVSVQKTTKKRKFVFITKQFEEIANQHQWTKIDYSLCWIDKNFHRYGKISAHSFRHFYVTLLYQELSKLTTISNFIQHSKPSMTEKYLIRDKETERKLIDKTFTFKAVKKYIKPK